MRTTVLQALPRPRGLAGLAALLFASSIAACHADGPVSVAGSTSRTFSADVGAEIRVTLGTVGSGEYSSPPNVSATAVRFLDVSNVGPATPGGPRQLFRFKAVARGRAILVFHHTVQNLVVEDTVDVR